MYQTCMKYFCNMLPSFKRHHESRVVNAVVAAGESTRGTPSASVTEEGQIHADVSQAGLDRQVWTLVPILSVITRVLCTCVIHFHRHVLSHGHRTPQATMIIGFPPMLRAGDRVGVCLSSLDAKLLERGVLATPGSLKSLTTAVALVRKVSVHKNARKRLQPGE